jgi:hypothetical protein
MFSTMRERVTNPWQRNEWARDREGLRMTPNELTDRFIVIAILLQIGLFIGAVAVVAVALRWALA